MNLYSEWGAAYDHLYRRYITSPKEKIFYMILCKVGSKEFYTVMSEEEAEKYKVNTKKTPVVVGNSDNQKKIRLEYQTRINSEQGKKERLYRQYVKSARQEIKLRKKLDD